MSPQINCVRVLKTASAFYLSFSRKRVKRRFLIASAPDGNEISCRGLRDAHKLQVGGA
jgi:hypothetical protein